MRDKWLVWGLWWTALLVFGAYLLFWLREPPDALVVRMPDDAFYYFKIARNIASGQGVTFDGINPTNGFQPLWLLLLLLPASLARSLSAEAFHRLAMMYQIAIFVLGLVLLNKAVVTRFGPLPRAVMHALALSVGVTILLRGMESAAIWLTFCLLIFWLACVGHLQQAHPRHWGMLGVLLGLVCLARLDMIFSVGTYILVLLWGGLQPTLMHRRWHYAYLLVGFALPTVPYLLYNAVQFGDIMPISGRLKSAFPQLALFTHGMPPIPAIATLAMGIGLMLSSWLWRAARPCDAICLLLLSWSVGNLLHWIHTALFMKWGILVSHFAAYWIPLVMLLPMIIQHAEQCKPYLAHGVGILGAVAALLWAFQDVRACYRIKHAFPVHWRTSMYRAALWAKQHTPPTAVFGMTDAGIFGYYSERKVVNLDGVVNNREYQDYLRRRQLAEYIRRKGIQYLVVYVVPDSPRFPTPSRRGDRFTDVYHGRYREFRFGYYARLYGDAPSDEVSLFRTNEVYRERHSRGMLIIWSVAAADFTLLP